MITITNKYILKISINIYVYKFVNISSANHGMRPTVQQANYLHDAHIYFAHLRDVLNYQQHPSVRPRGHQRRTKVKWMQIEKESPSIESSLESRRVLMGLRLSWPSWLGWST